MKKIQWKISIILIETVRSNRIAVHVRKKKKGSVLLKLELWPQC